MTDFWKTILDFAETTTERIGVQLLKDFGHVSASRKADGTLVTQADKWADTELHRAIANTFPSHGILSEEAEHIFPANEWCWIVDPLDGTTNFARGIPLWGISIGLLYRGTPVFGCVHFPPIDRTFYGFWDISSQLDVPTGAFVDGDPIRISEDEPSNNHFFSLCARSTSIIGPGFPCKIRMLGVATYNFLMVGCGAAIGGVEATPKIWDLAAVYPIVRAAGAVWVSLESAPIFPLKVGENYGQRALPTLVVSRPELVSVFEPLVQPLRKI
jgi:myo-inositol-1(or 4)-monophosphatase